MLDLNNRTPKTRNSGISGHFANEPEPTFSDSDYLQSTLSKIVTQEFVDEFFREYYSRENRDNVTPKQLIDFVIGGSRRNCKPQFFDLLFCVFINMLHTYINTNNTATIVTTDIHFTTTGAPTDWANRYSEVTNGVYKINKVTPQRKKKAKFKQSKFDQINSFGKRN